MTIRRLPFLVLASVAWFGAAAAAPLTLEQRVSAQRAIERVRWDHRIWPDANPGAKPPFESSVPDSALRAKVGNYLAKVAAVARFGTRPITPGEIQRELDRMARHSKNPGVLQELFAALGHDARLVAECLALPAVADRRLRDLHALDPVRSATPFDAWWHETAPSLRPVEPKDGTFTLPMLGGVNCTDDTWSATPIAHPVARWLDHIVWTGSEVVVWSGGNPGGEMSGGRYDPATDVWYPIAIDDGTPPGTIYGTLIWTGERVIAWGGADGLTKYNAGGRYDPVTDSWQPTSRGPGCPSPRFYHTAVWSGTEMIVWGGELLDATRAGDGGRYDPETDSWVAIPATLHSPSARARHVAVWTGDEMIVWSGGGPAGSGPGGILGDGKRYDPLTDAWTPISTMNAPAGREECAYTWSGTELLIWGGIDWSTLYGDGARYDPENDTWAPMASAGAPSPRRRLPAAWTGSRFFVWGGQAGDSDLGDGALYDPASNSWTPIATGGAPEPRSNFGAVWTGSEVVVWGGTNGYMSYVYTGGRYDPESDTWMPTSIGASMPNGRSWHSAVWTGSEMIVWGGTSRSGGQDLRLNTGGRYDPATDGWTLSAQDAATPIARDGHSVVWTGTRMIVWGGALDVDPYSANSGASYDPALDAWTPTAVVAETPVARYRHAAAWTGTEMIVWGGTLDGFTATASGGRYVPASDTWTPTLEDESTPSPREGVAAAWTGSELIVWGGSYWGFMGPRGLGDGARYSPANDQWLPMSPSGAPEARFRHAAVWTGNEMVVWGGYAELQGPTNSGGRYLPTSDIWASTSQGSDVPTGREEATAVWTGREMIVWGNSQSFGIAHETGGRYEPAFERGDRRRQSDRRRRGAVTAPSGPAAT